MLSGTADDSEAWRWPHVRCRPALALLALVLAVALVQAMTVSAALLAEASPLPAYAPFVWHASGALGVWFALPAVQCAVLNGFGARVGWLRRVLVHVASFAVFAAVQLGVMFGLRALLALALALPLHRDQHSLGYQISWDAQNDLVLYAGLVALLAAFRAREERAHAAVRAAQLESRLAAARLEALTLQLDPHFLYNALNSVSAIMYEDLSRAERMIANLGQLLRASLDTREPTWCLRDELAHARRYVELLGMGLEGRLLLEWQVDEAIESAAVPRSCVQGLLENALKHNRHRVEALRVRVQGWREQGLVHLSVDDDGSGFEPDAALGAEHGLGRLHEMLQLLHGSNAGVSIGRGQRGGARVALAFRGL